MSDIGTALAIGAIAGTPIALVGNWLAITLGTRIRNAKARRR